MSTQVIIHSLAIVFVIAGVTVFTRFAPFVIFGKCKQIPRVIRYLGAAMPAAVIIMLIIYCLRNTAISVYPFGLPELIACIATATLHWFGKNTLLSIAGGTVLYMILVQVVFI